MDPPSFGRGPDGEVWKLETDLYPLLMRTVGVLSASPLFVLINSYTTGLQPTVIADLLKLALKDKGKCAVDAYELAIPTDQGIDLPCGCSGIATFEN